MLVKQIIVLAIVSSLGVMGFTQAMKTKDAIENSPAVQQIQKQQEVLDTILEGDDQKIMRLENLKSFE